MVGPNDWTTRQQNQGASRRMRSGPIRAHNAVRCLASGPVLLQLPFPGPHQVGTNILFTRSLANRLAAFQHPSATRDLKAAVYRRRFLTIVLPPHMPVSTLHYTPELVDQFLGPGTQFRDGSCRFVPANPKHRPFGPVSLRNTVRG